MIQYKTEKIAFHGLEDKLNEMSLQGWMMDHIFQGKDEHIYLLMYKDTRNLPLEIAQERIQELEKELKKPWWKL